MFTSVTAHVWTECRGSSSTEPITCLGKVPIRDICYMMLTPVIQSSGCQFRTRSSMASWVGNATLNGEPTLALGCRNKLTGHIPCGLGGRNCAAQIQRQQNVVRWRSRNLEWGKQQQTEGNSIVCTLIGVCIGLEDGSYSDAYTWGAQIGG